MALESQVLIVGAGPTGLALAVWLTRQGVRVRIIDKSDRPGTTSRAIGLQARTLELHHQLGLADAMVEAGFQFKAANLWVEGRRLSRAAFVSLGPGLSPYPIFPYLMFPQDEYEKLMVEQLRAEGVTVERNTELLDFTQDDSRVRVRISCQNREEILQISYLAGCDGARSLVRHSLGIDFPGSTYPHIFFVADVRARGPAINRELHLALNNTDFFAVFPLKAAGRVRLIGTVNRSGDALLWEEAERSVERRLDLQVEEVHWFSTYRVHNRIADRFRQGRCFLLGDAAHVHSPVGAQGMNTGIGDAVNLAWKLAGALKREDDGWLGTYEFERRAFARTLVMTTDQAFRMVTSNSPVARFLRCRVAPLAIPWLLALRPVRRLLFRYISQTAVNYRRSPLSQGKAEEIRGGDRWPGLTSFDWQVHFHGLAGPAGAQGDPLKELRQLCATHSLPLSTFHAKRPALFLIRPDGYVALAEPSADHGKLAQYLDRLMAPSS